MEGNNHFRARKTGKEKLMERQGKREGKISKKKMGRETGEEVERNNLTERRRSR
jgi:hypothetical protein